MIPLFIRMPDSGSVRREPKIDSSVCVTAAMFPCRSTTQKCEVHSGARAPSMSPIQLRRNA
jgi:hypothetical protein